MSAKPPSTTPLWAQLFALDHHTGLPLQSRLRLKVVQVILDGRLAAGAALPSSRDLAQVLGLSRNTVTAVYQQLVDEGYLESRPRSGVFVQSGARPLSIAQADRIVDPFSAEGAATGAAPQWQQRVLRSLRQQPTLSKPDQWREFAYPFVYGTHDAQLFPTEDFRECCVRSLARSQLPNWTPDFETDDMPDLIEQIRTRLLPKRGVFARPEEILVTVGAQHACYLVAEALFDRGTRVGFEEPGYPHVRNAFSLRTSQLIGIPVDHEGLVVDALPDLDYVFVTPSHQSPTTHTLSLERRQWLLRKAALQDFVIVEDDYEAENLYAGEPTPALKSLDKTGRVIYIGSLSKSLSPALRLGYIVAQKELIEELRVLRHAMVRHPSAFLQHAYALFLSLGHHDSHARRVNQVLRQRMDAVTAALAAHLPECESQPAQGGASVWVKTPDWLDGAALSLRARQHGVLIEPGDVFFANPPRPCPYFRLRLSSIDLGQIEPGIRALRDAVRGMERERERG
ncbi:MocR-like pyridoxine biosynthesis transcription factor PdxR [Variovorax sp. PAMC 28711]|uniref:MocR-like pyridoxine biosynthesis transcription factor PdxR n=1 Tax=Variovorax sp. PAMC 28711 TaxID=1795631 RepID=UPI00078E419B|nr:PLP-dependent aminotransferase family protein [Variovorax sp. PAMC 28711]AMM26745.1 GntR family transcriptional regulator [Variovorax sp. PAMC 28711]